MTDTNEKDYEVTDLSGGVQRKSTKFTQKSNQVDLAVNTSFRRIGGIEKIKGTSRLGNTITTSSTSSTTSTSTSTSSSTSSSTSTSSSSTTTAAP